MPITDRSTKEPILKVGQLTHGTLYCTDVVKTRRFYEEVLGIECVQLTHSSLIIRKGNAFTYALVEIPVVPHEMHLLNHNGFEVSSREEVDACYKKIMEIKDEWEIKKVTKPRLQHGDYQFYFADRDGNWWEIVEEKDGGYITDFTDPAHDLTGRHDVEPMFAAYEAKGKHLHMHTAEDRAAVAAFKPQG